MRKFYFIFSNEPDMPYEEGYIVVWASGIKEAVDRFMKAYPPVNGGLQLRCSRIIEEGDDFVVFKGPQHEVLGWRD